MPDATVRLKFSMVENFFDSEKIVRAMDRATLAALSKAGAFVRQRARTSIRKRKKPGSPGQPPSSHEGGLRKGILFAYDNRRKSVVIGPVAYNGDAGRVPSLLEFGGSIKRTITRRKTRYHNGQRQPTKQVKTLHYHAFPYMGPALAAEAPKFPDFWTGKAI